MVIVGLASLWPGSAVAGTLVKNWQIAGYNGFATGLALSPDGTRVVAVHQGNFLRVFRSSDRRAIYSDVQLGGQSPRLAPPYGSDSFFLAREGPNGIHVELRLFSTGQRQLDVDVSSEPTLTGQIAAGTPAAFYLHALEADGPDRIIEFRQNGGTYTKSFTWNAEGGRGLAVSPDGRWLAIGNESQVLVFDTLLKSQVPIATLTSELPAQSQYQTIMAFSPDNFWLAIQDDWNVNLVECASWSKVRSIFVGSYPNVAWESDSASMYNARGGFLARNLTNGTEIFHSYPPVRSSSIVHRCKFGDLLAFDGSDGLNLWTSFNSSAGAIPAHLHTVQTIDYSFDDSFVVTSDWRSVVRWDTTTGIGRRLHTEPLGNTLIGAGSGGGELLVASRYWIKRMSPDSGNLRQTVDTPVKQVSHWTSHGSATSNSVLVTKVSFGTHGSVTAYVDGAQRNLVRVRKKSDLSVVGSFDNGTEVSDLVVSPDGRYFATLSSSMDSVKVWSSNSFTTPIATLALTPAMAQVSLGPNATYLAISQLNVLKLYKRSGSSYVNKATKTLGADYRYNKHGFLRSAPKLIVFTERTGQTPDPRLHFLAIESLVSERNEPCTVPGRTFTPSNFDQYLFFPDYENLGCAWQCWNSLRPPEPWTIDRSPSTVTGGQPVTCSLNLTAAAPVGGVTASCYSGDPSVASPRSPVVFVPASQKSATFVVDTYAVSASKSVAITCLVNKPAKGTIIVRP